MAVKLDPCCATNGKTLYECVREGCDYEETGDPSAEARHIIGSVVSVPTCCDRAVYNCEVCGQNFEAYDDDEEGQATGEHKYDVKGKTVAPTCSAEGYTEYGCSAGDCGTTENKNIVERTAHQLVDVNEYGVIKCVVCDYVYRNVTTIVNNGSGTLCLGCNQTPCVCSVNVEWNGYTEPSAPEAITAGEEFTKSYVEEKETALEIGGGLIYLVSEAEANYTITIGDVVIEVSGTEVVVDLYKLESVTSVTIISDAAAEVVFYEKVA